MANVACSCGKQDVLRANAKVLECCSKLSRSLCACRAQKGPDLVRHGMAHPAQRYRTALHFEHRGVVENRAVCGTPDSTLAGSEAANPDAEMFCMYFVIRQT